MSRQRKYQELVFIFCSKDYSEASVEPFYVASFSFPVEISVLQRKGDHRPSCLGQPRWAWVLAEGLLA
jgi:hypothetical protein